MALIADSFTLLYAGHPCQGCLPSDVRWDPYGADRKVRAVVVNLESESGFVAVRATGAPAAGRGIANAAEPLITRAFGALIAGATFLRAGGVTDRFGQAGAIGAGR